MAVRDGLATSGRRWGDPNTSAPPERFRGNAGAVLQGGRQLAVRTEQVLVQVDDHLVAIGGSAGADVAAYPWAAEVTMGDTSTVENLILDLVEWLARRERTYRDTMDAWRTSCPRLPVWEEANERGFVEVVSEQGRSLVRATAVGLAFLTEKRPPSV